MNTPSFIKAAVIAALVSATALAGVEHRQLSQVTTSGYKGVSAPAISTDGTRVYFHSSVYEDDGSGYYNQFTVPSAGGVATVDDKTGYGSTTETPDGLYVIYRRSSDDGSVVDGLYSRPVGGGTPTLLVATNDVYPYKISISPDSATVVIEDLDGNLYAIPVAGGTAVLLTPAVWSATSGGDLRYWEFTPDSKYVICTNWGLGSNPNEVRSARVTTGVQHSLYSTTSSFGGFRVSPDGTRVVINGDNELVSIHPNGTGSTVLVSVSGFDSMPYYASTMAISADSSTVYFAAEIHSLYNGATSLFTVPIDGSAGPTLVAAAPGGGIAYYPGLAMSPDGSYLVFLADSSSADGKLYSLKTATNAVTALAAPDVSTTNQSDTDAQVVITPDSSKVLFFASSAGSPYYGVLYSTAIDGSGTYHQLTRDSLGSNDLDFDDIGTRVLMLPDSSGIVYSMDEVSADVDDLWYIGINGGARRKLNATLASGGYASYPYLSTDGSFMVYYGVHASAPSPGVAELYRVDLPGGARTLLAPTTTTPGEVDKLDKYNADTTGFRVSPDGAWAVYLAEETTFGINELRAARTDGSTRVRLTGPMAADDRIQSFQITPDSSRVVWVVYDAAASTYLLQSAAINGTSRVTLADLQSYYSARDYVLSADSSCVIFSTDGTSPGTYNLWSMPVAGGTATQLDAGTAGSRRGSYDDLTVNTAGTIVAFEAYDSGAGKYVLYTVPATGGSLTTVTSRVISGEDLTFSPDGNYLVWTDTSSTGVTKVHSCPATGGSVITLASSPISYGISSLQITPDSSKVLVYGQLQTDNQYEIGIVSITGGTFTILNGSLTAEGDVTYFTIAPDSSHVVYLADAIVDGQDNLFSVATDGTGRVRLNAALPAGSEVTEYVIVPNSNAVVYRADENTYGQFELVKVPIAGGARTYLSGTLSATVSVEAGIDVGADATHAIFRADLSVNGRVELYTVDLLTNVITKLNSSLISAGDVSGFRLSDDGQLLLYRADDSTDESNQLHAAWSPPTITPVADQISLINVPVGPVAFTVSDVDLNDHLLSVSAASSNITLLPIANITFGGSGASRTVLLTPAPGKWGLAFVTLTVSDGLFTNQIMFRAVFTPDPNDVPTDIGMAGSPFPENILAGTAVATFNTVDADPWDSHTYSLVPGFGSTDNASFTIITNHLVAVGPFDFETKPALTVRIRSTDMVGAFTEKAFPLALLDVTGIPKLIDRTAQQDRMMPFLASDWTSNFILADGGSLQKLRFPSLPAHGTLGLMFHEQTVDSTFATPRAVAAGKVNPDLLMDLVAVSDASQTLVWYERIPGPTVTFNRRIIAAGALLNGACDMELVDLDKDGDNDIIVAAQVAGQIRWYENDGAPIPAFTPHVAAAAVGVRSVAIADVDHDGFPDIVSSLAGPGQVLWYRNNHASPPIFAANLVSAVEPGTTETVVEDLDKDGDLDLVTAGTTNGEVVWFESNGAPLPFFTRRIMTAAAPGVRSVAVGDLDADGKPDVVYASTGSNAIGWHRNTGGSPAVFAIMPTISSAAGSPEQVRIGDINGDSKLDVLAACPGSNNVRLWINAPASFSEFVVDSDASGVTSVAIVDLDGNTQPDIISASHSSSEIAWYKDRTLLTIADEVQLNELQKVSYMANPGYVGQDNFTWQGFDGVQWSATSAIVHITVYGQQYMAWLATHFGGLDPATKATVWGPYADADSDGRSNIMEYALGTDPKDGSDSSDGTVQSVADDGTGHNYLYYSYLRLRNEPSLTYTLESSTDLSNWYSGPTYFQFISDVVVDPTYGEATYKALPSTDVAPSLFVRLSVTWAIE